jgi:hypothetical protein
VRWRRVKAVRCRHWRLVEAREAHRRLSPADDCEVGRRPGLLVYHAVVRILVADAGQQFDGAVAVASWQVGPGRS